MSNFSEIKLITVNLAILGFILSFAEFTDKYTLNQSIILTSAFGFLITIIGLYLFHIRKLEREDHPITMLNYSSLVYTNILSIAYLVIGFNIELIEASLNTVTPEMGLLISTLSLYLAVIRIFHKKNLHNENGFAFDRLGVNISTNMFIRSVSRFTWITMVIVSFYVSVEYLIP